MKNFIIAVACFLIAVSSVWSKYSTTKILDIPADNIDQFLIKCSDGRLNISGIDSLRVIKVTAEIVLLGMSEDKATRYAENETDLSLTKKRDKAVLEAFIEQPVGFFFLPIESDETAEIRLNIEIPAKMDIEIQAGETDITLEDLSGDVCYKKGKGLLVVHNYDGDMDIVSNHYSQVLSDDGEDDVLYFSDMMHPLRIDDFQGHISFYDSDGDVIYDVSPENIDDYLAYSRRAKIPPLPPLPDMPPLPDLPPLPELPVLPELHNLTESSQLYILHERPKGVRK